jgi:hypothetical protein
LLFITPEKARVITNRFRNSIRLDGACWHPG